LYVISGGKHTQCFRDGAAGSYTRTDIVLERRVGADAYLICRSAGLGLETFQKTNLLPRVNTRGDGNKVDKTYSTEWHIRDRRTCRRLSRNRPAQPKQPEKKHCACPNCHDECVVVCQERSVVWFLETNSWAFPVVYLPSDLARSTPWSPQLIVANRGPGHGRAPSKYGVSLPT
jgi:hypothetical protein